MVLKNYMYIHVQNSTIHNSENVELGQISINRWMDKINVIYAYNGILFSHKKEWSTDI